VANDYTEALAAAFDAVIDHVSEFVPDQIPVFAGDNTEYHMEFFMQLEQELDVVVQSLSSVVKEI
jgi:hypothetical protein